MNIMRTRNGVHLAPMPGLNRLLDGFLGEGVVTKAVATSYKPALDALDTPESFVVVLDIAGIDPATLEVSATGDELTISGERRSPDLPENSTWIVCERLVGKFRRTVSLPTSVDTEAIVAEAKHGVLTIRLPKRSEVLPKQISVDVK